MPQMRLDKLLSHLNCGSRKEVQALIRAGRVSVDGTVQKDPAFKVDPDRSQTAVDGTVQRYRAQRYYMLNKPMGVITASRDERHDTVLELFPAELRRGLFAVGRLDKDTEGLLLLTNDGPLAHAFGAGAACGQGLLCGGGRPAGPAGPAGLSGGSDPGRRDGVPAGGPDGAGPAQPGLGDPPGGEVSPGQAHAGRPREACDLSQTPVHGAPDPGPGPSGRGLAAVDPGEKASLGR